MLVRDNKIKSRLNLNIFLPHIKKVRFLSVCVGTI